MHTPRSYACAACFSSTELGDRRNKPSSCKPSQMSVSKHAHVSQGLTCGAEVLYTILHHAWEASLLAVESHKFLERDAEEV